MVAALNPKGISGIADLKRGDVRFVNRQRGSGTRLEVDQWLQQERIAPVTVAGYDNVETTHLAVAAAIASGTADAGVGIQAAAAQIGLDFMPLAQEQYYLVCLKETLKLPAVVRLRELLQRGDWKEAMRSLPGHDTTAAGEVVALRAAMPWYAFRKPES